MALLGRFNFVLQDRLGNALNGVSIYVRKQAAMVNGAQAGIASGANILVRMVGGLVTGDTVSINSGSTSYTATVVDATHIQLSGFVGTIDLADGDRIHASTNLPSAYTNPVAGGSALTWPLVTDSDGKASCFMPVQGYTIYMTGGALSSAEIRYDEAPAGVEWEQSNEYTTGSAVAYKRDTRRSLAVGDKHTQWLIAGVEIASLAYDGSVTLAGGLTVAGGIVNTAGYSGTTGSFSGTLHATGAVDFDSTLDVDGAANFDAAVTIGGLLTANGGLTVVGALTLPAGSVETADLATNAATITRVGHGTADTTLAAAAAYNTANYQDLPGVAVGPFTPAASTSEFVAIATVHFENNGGTYEGYMAIRSGSSNLSEAGIADGTSSSGQTLSNTVTYRVSGITASQTWKVSAQCTVGTPPDVNDSTHNSKTRISRLIVMEFKK